jgi:hypothetical protein
VDARAQLRDIYFKVTRVNRGTLHAGKLGEIVFRESEPDIGLSNQNGKLIDDR